MLDGMQLYRKLKEEAAKFNAACARKEWAHARYIYLGAHYTALLAEADEDEISELFGNDVFIPEDEEPVQGLFPGNLVEKAGWECVKNHFTLDELHLHPREQIFPHGAGDCITAVCTRYHPEGIPTPDWLQAVKK